MNHGACPKGTSLVTRKRPFGRHGVHGEYIDFFSVRSVISVVRDLSWV